MQHRAFLAALLVIVSAAVSPPALSQESTLKFDVRDPSGAPVKGGRVAIRGFGETTIKNKLTAGELVTMTVEDGQGNTATKTIAVPRAGSITVKFDLAPRPPNFDASYAQATKAAEAGDSEAFDKHMKDAETALDHSKQELKRDQEAVDEWARQNNLPILTYSQILDAQDRDKARGVTPQNSSTARLMERYAQYRWALTLRGMLIRRNEERIDDEPYYAEGGGSGATAPVAVEPGACPDGEGGLLAGWINSMTGSDLAAACGVNATRDKNKKGAGGDGEGRDGEEHD